jgi:2-polyprenyl-6-methoxyphenol hydroxylase-like FAD-dependent oxidoreductase
MEEFPVLIIGGSLSGLTTAALLAQHGVRCVVVERHPATTVQYKFRGISPRSMEIYRSLGLEAQIRAHRTGDQKAGEIARAPNLASAEVHFQGKPWSDMQDLSAATAETCDQDRLEPILRARAEQLGANIRFGTELVDLEATEQGVIARVRSDAADGVQVIRASYAIACDGVNGNTRERVGIGRHGPGVLQHWMNVIFDADLQPYLQGKRITTCFVTDINGTLVPREDRWLLALQYSPERGEKPEDFDQARTEALVRKAAGKSDLRVKLFDARAWEVSAYVADRFSSDRVFLVGDAAHTMPPTGGFGGNTGIHDAHNLAWKLALVLKGVASPRLLDTYDSERRPIADATLVQALARLAAWFKNLGDKLPPTPPIAKDEAVIFGQCYATGTFEDPRAPSAGLGSRAPHGVARSHDGLIPVHDLVGQHFLLLSGAEGHMWEDIAAAIARELKVSLRFARLRAEDVALARTYRLDEEGSVLIRPDGVIAWRSAPGANDLREGVRHVLAGALI